MSKIKLVLISTFLFLAACDAGTMLESSTNSNSSRANIAATDPNERTGGGGGGGRTKDQSVTAQQVSLDQAANTQTQPTVTERKIIRNADLKLESNSPAEAQQKITQIAESKNGFVVETNQTSSDVRTSTRDIVNMTIRIPAEKFDEAINEIRAAGTRVIEETVKGQDVTEEFIDIEARLKAKRALEEQFLEIMKRAATVEDALRVQTQLAEVRGEIEQIEGRKRFLENQAALSTIKIQLQTPTSLSANPGGFFYELKEALSSGFNAALKFVLFFVTAAIALVPFFILIVLPLYFILRYFWRKQASKKTPEKTFRDDTDEQ